MPTAAVVLLSAACQAKPTDLTTASAQEQTAAANAACAVLDQVVQAASERDFDALCTHASSLGICRFQLQGNEATVPTTAPTVDCVKFVAPRDGRVGGVVLVVSGVDGAGSAYRSEFFIIDTGNGV